VVIEQMIKLTVTRNTGFGRLDLSPMFTSLFSGQTRAKLGISTPLAIQLMTCFGPKHSLTDSTSLFAIATHRFAIAFLTEILATLTVVISHIDGNKLAMCGGKETLVSAEPQVAKLKLQCAHLALLLLEICSY
jgi:hypothetical protein